VREYFRAQSRFKILTEEQIADIQNSIDAKWARYYKKDD
jgi:pyruvate ferredoxin oxidoreductase beta subunit